jgi:hypothetical protein
LGEMLIRILDTEMPVSTIRSWTIGESKKEKFRDLLLTHIFLGLIFAIVISGLNQFFFFRFPSVTIGNVRFMNLPCRKHRPYIYVPACCPTFVLPCWQTMGSSHAQRLHFWGPAESWPILSEGTCPFNDNGYSCWWIGLRCKHLTYCFKHRRLRSLFIQTDIVAVQRVYYNQVYNFSYQWLVVMSTQLIGFSIGGIARRFLVQPPSMIWPANLVNCALFNTLHSQVYAGMGNRGGMSRERL